MKIGYGFTEFENDYMEFHAYENGKVVELDPKEKQGYIDYEYLKGGEKDER